MAKDSYAQTAKRVGMAGAMKQFLREWDLWGHGVNPERYGRLSDAVQVLRAAYVSFDEKFPEERD